MRTLIKQKNRVKLYKIESPDSSKPEATRYRLVTPRTPEEFMFNNLIDSNKAFDDEVKRVEEQK